jgi:hypothetical protein
MNNKRKKNKNKNGEQDNNQVLSGWVGTSGRGKSGERM